MKFFSTIALLFALIAGSATAQSYTACETLIKPVPLSPATNNAWGAQLNTNFDLIDTAVGGGLPVSVAGSSNVVLQSFTGAPDQSRYRYYNFTGAISANVTVFFPQGRCRQFIAANNTTGSFTLTIAAGSVIPLGTTISIPQGSTLSLYSDGTNVINVSNIQAAPTALNVANLTALRANNATYLQASIQGTTTAADNGGGSFFYNPTDTTSADNGTTIIVDAAGHRWYRGGGFANYTFQNVAALRLNIAAISQAYIQGYALAADGGGGTFVYNSTDTTSTDNGSTIIVDAALHRWYRLSGAPVYFASTAAALQALQIPNSASGFTATLGGYYALGDMPPVRYTLSSSPCSIGPGVGDGGSQLPSALGGCWLIGQNSVWDLRWWGARGDVTNSTTVATISSGICDVQTAASIFASTDAATPAKSITITDAIASSPNGASYYGKIASYISATHITVSAPCPAFNSSIAQVITWGHIDTAAANAAMTFLNTGDQSVSGQPVMDGAGRAYGFDNTFHMKGNTSVNNVSGIAMTPVNIGVSSALASWEGSFQTGYNDVWDSNYLPVNACTGTTNGRIVLHDQRCKNWLGSYPNPVTFTGVATINAATFNGTVSGCTGAVSRRCTLTVNSGLSGTIQLGQGLSDPGSTTLDGTYIIAYGAAANTYIVFNRTANPTAGARSMTTLALDITVNNCVAANFDQQIAGVNGSMGLISHNGQPGISDRTYIVGCPNATTALLNKAPKTKLSASSATFYIDSNGVYLPKGVASVGIQWDQLSTDLDNFIDGPGNEPGNQYGASIYSDAAGGDGFTNASTFQGAAGVVLGPDAAGNRFFLSQHVSNFGATCCELNGPTLISQDGADNTTLGNWQDSGQIQIFNAVLGNTTPKFQLTDPVFLQNTGATLYAPGNLIWFYTEIASTLVDDITLSPFGVNQIANGGTDAQLMPNMLALTTGGSGSWSEYQQYQLQQIASSSNFLLPANASNPLAIGSPINTMGLGLLGAKRQTNFISGNYTFSDADCGYDDIFLTNGATLTVPATLGGTISSTGGLTCDIWINSGTGVALTLSRGSGAALWNGGSNGSTVSLSANVPTLLKVFTNAGGAAQAYAMKMSN